MLRATLHDHRTHQYHVYEEQYHEREKSHGQLQTIKPQLSSGALGPYLSMYNLMCNNVSKNMPLPRDSDFIYKKTFAQP